jgi:glycosyltransferase involved in cell wall biosynthesis
VNQKRVLMLIGGPSFEQVWADAAATHAEVTRLALVDPLVGDLTPLDMLRRDPERRDTYRVHRARQRSSNRLVRRVHRRRLADRLARSTEYLQHEHGPFDLVHSHFSASGRLVSRMASTIGVPFVITEHSTSFSEMNAANRLSRVGLAYTRKYCGEAAAVLPVSAQLQAVMEQHGIRANFSILPNPVDTTRFRPPDQLPSMETTDIIAVGRLAPVKGHDLLLEAVARLQGRRPTVRLTIVGAGPERGALEARARELGVDEIVTFTGRLSPADTAERVRRSHVFALASRWENLSVAVLEACVVGLPTIVTRVGGLSEIEAEGIQIVEPGDVDGLVEALDGVLENLPDLETRRRWAAAARDRYGSAAVGQRLAEIYDEVLRDR